MRRLPTATPATTEYVHLRKPSRITCGITDSVRITDRLIEATCPRCQYEGDPVDETRALQVERAHAEALAVDIDRYVQQGRDEMAAVLRAAVADPVAMSYRLEKATGDHYQLYRDGIKDALDLLVRHGAADPADRTTD